MNLPDLEFDYDDDRPFKSATFNSSAGGSVRIIDKIKGGYGNKSGVSIIFDDGAGICHKSIARDFDKPHFRAFIDLCEKAYKQLP